MAIKSLNSVGGYTVGIPPIPIISETGNLSVADATMGNLVVNGNGTVNGNLTADLFIGTFSGNISGDLVVPGSDTWVLFNNHGNAGTDAGFTFDSTQQLVTIHGDLVANSITLGSGTSQFSSSRVLFATTASSALNQVLHRTVATTICSIDYTIIATDPTGNNRQTSKLFAGVLGTEVGYYEYGSIDVPYLGPGVGDFKVTYNNGNVELTVSPFTSNLVDYKIMVTSYKE